MNKYWIPYNTPSSKNSKIWTGKFLVMSKSVQRWQRLTRGYWALYKNEFIGATKDMDRPLFIYMIFVRGSKRIFDYHNASQIVLDTMKEYGWIQDDNADEVVPVFGRYRYSRDSPGVIIRVLMEKPIYKF